MLIRTLRVNNNSKCVLDCLWEFRIFAGSDDDADSGRTRRTGLPEPLRRGAVILRNPAAAIRSAYFPLDLSVSVPVPGRYPVTSAPVPTFVAANLRLTLTAFSDRISQNNTTAHHELSRSVERHSELCLHGPLESWTDSIIPANNKVVSRKKEMGRQQR
ncbi:hypothetical protein J6590_073299 [Homalodisca vitripennis]|nr:hypothetical protein J6590_073299 [Homalodisca vitripennis]